MPNKPQIYSELAERTSVGLTKSVNDWCFFLKSQAKLYKYDYADQLMIYAQRPDATLCLDFDSWTKTMNRYIHKGSKGIGLIDYSGDTPKMKYVFDISDTSEKFNSRPLNVWQRDEAADDEVISAISDYYGIDKSTHIEDMVFKACRREARTYVQDHMKDFGYIVDGSFMEDYDNDNRYKSLYTLAKNSTVYVAMERCGIDPEGWFAPEDFMGIFDYNTSEVINFLGNCVSECSENVLRIIERAEKQFERSQTNDLQREEQSYVSRPDSRKSEEAEPREVRADEETVSQEQQEVAVEQPDSEGTTEQSPKRDSAESRADDQPGNDGIGDCGETDLQLNLFGQPFGDLYDENAESKFDKLFSASSVINDESINAVLRLCDNTDKARMMIAAEFSKEKPTEDKVAFLKEIYHGGYGLINGSSKMSAFFDEEGMHINGGSKAFALGKKTLTWEWVSERITDLLESGEFTNDMELHDAPFLERRQLAESIWYMERDLTEEGDKYFTCFNIFDEHKGFNDEVIDLSEALQDEKYIKKLSKEFNDFKEAYSANRDLLRFHFHKVDKISERISDLLLPRKEWSSVLTDDDTVTFGSFITEDEIDKALAGGSGVSNGKLRIADFFEKNKENKARADFLKNEYGTGGHSHAVSGANHSGESHDAKGIVLTKAKCSALHLSWSDVAKKIDGLIKTDRYLNDKEKSELESMRNKSLDKTDMLMEDSVKDWYCSKYPTDGLGGNIAPSITFNDVNKSLENGDNIYEIIGVGDSVVRERVFTELADRMNVDYDEIYNKWLDDDEPKELQIESLPKNPMDRYNAVKEHYPEHICFIQVGEFYEAFGEDAKKVADALDLVLTGRLMEGTETRIPMCGFPLHNQDLYFQKLADKGLVPLAVARNMAEKVEIYDTAKNWDKKDRMPEDAIARAKPSVLKKLQEAKEKVEITSTKKQSKNIEEIL